MGRQDIDKNIYFIFFFFSSRIPFHIGYKNIYLSVLASNHFSRLISYNY